MKQRAHLSQTSYIALSGEVYYSMEGLDGRVRSNLGAAHAAECKAFALFVSQADTYMAGSFMITTSMAGKGGPGKGGNGNGSGNDEEGKTGIVTKTRPKTKKPSLYKVLLLNDDYTPMEFVVHVLERYFGKNRDEATKIMLHVHQKGVGICGVYTYEVAETKVTQVMDFARQHGHPLQCTLEKE